MEVQANEQVNLTAQATEVEKGELGEDCLNDTSFGKFKTAKALLDAYNSLQAEFTRRCTRIKELEGQLVKDNEVGQAESSAPDFAQEKAGGNQTETEEELLGKFLSSKTTAKFITKGSALESPIIIPKTIKEAGKFASEIFNL